jgi:outer membrane protein assembly factor BamB
MDRRTFVGTAATAGTAAALSALAVSPGATARAMASGGQSTPPTASRVPSPAQPTSADKAHPAAFYGGPTPDIPKVGLRWAFSATVFFADRIMIQSPLPRGYTSVGGGEIWGPRLQGRVLPASGADYYKGTFNTYYMFEASDGALIFIHNRGTMRRFQAPPEAGKPLTPVTTTDPATPGWMRFRATPVFTAPEGPHDWMNRAVFVANSQRQSNPDHTVFTYYEVL